METQESMQEKTPGDRRQPRISILDANVDARDETIRLLNEALSVALRELEMARTKAA